MTRVCPFAEQKMSAKQTKGFRFPEEKCHEVTKGDGRVTLSVRTEGTKKFSAIKSQLYIRAEPYLL